MIQLIKPANRLGHVKEYYFSRKLKEIARLNAEGKDIVSLGIGGSDLPPPPQAVEHAVECLRRADSHGYQMSSGLPALRKAFAGWYARQYAKRKRIGEEIMAALGCCCRPGQQGLFLWGRIAAGAESSEMFADKILSEARVFVTPGFIFGRQGENYIRISLCATEERLRQALKRINETLKK